MRGQFDVLVNGVCVASRSRHVFVRLLKTGWPRTEDVISAVRRRLQATG